MKTFQQKVESSFREGMVILQSFGIFCTAVFLFAVLLYSNKVLTYKEFKFAMLFMVICTALAILGFMLHLPRGMRAKKMVLKRILTTVTSRDFFKTY